jgi:dTDP-4-amino-4,6-dideoxygalactose transaminase
MAAASAAATLAAMPQADAEVAVRRGHAAELSRDLPAAFRAVQPPAGAEPGWLRLPLLADASGARAGDVAARRLGVMRGYPRVLADLPGFAARCRNGGAAFPGARELAERLVTLPTHGRLAPRDIAALRRWMRQW